MNVDTGYQIFVGEVIKANSKSKEIIINILSDDPNFHTIIMNEDQAWKFMTPHAPTLRRGIIGDEIFDYFRITDEDAFNFTTGFMNFPQIGDFLVLAAYIHTPVGSTTPEQLVYREVIVLGYLAHHNPQLEGHDNILMDRSGAKIHFNHTWLDSKNMSIVESPGRQLSGAPGRANITGHLTIAGNRLVVLSGKKFLPFSGLSHKFSNGLPKDELYNNAFLTFEGQYKKGSNDEQRKATTWKELFTRDLAHDIFDPDFSKELNPKGDSNKFLEPPSALPEEDMKMHDSGWKRLIREDMSENKILRSSMILYGDAFKQHSFAPEAKQSWGSGTTVAQGKISTGFTPANRDILNEVSPPHPDTAKSEYYMIGTTMYARRVNAAAHGLADEILDGVSINIPVTAPTTPSAAKTMFADATKKAESGKYKIYVKGNTKVEIDGNADTVVITNGSVTMTMSGGTVNVA